MVILRNTTAEAEMFRFLYFIDPSLNWVVGTNIFCFYIRTVLKKIRTKLYPRTSSFNIMTPFLTVHLWTFGKHGQTQGQHQNLGSMYFPGQWAPQVEPTAPSIHQDQVSVTAPCICLLHQMGMKSPTLVFWKKKYWSSACILCFNPYPNLLFPIPQTEPFPFFFLFLLFVLPARTCYCVIPIFESF